MKVQQIYSILNTVIGETLGKSDIVSEDLHNVVDIGKEFDSGSTTNSNLYDNYVKSLINHIGKVVFVNRPYGSRAPSVLMDGWEYGSILEKIDCGIPDSEQTNDWQLVSGTTYNQDVFTAPKDVKAKFWNKRTTFTVPFSYTEKQVRESFSSVQQLNGFFSMIENRIRMRLTIDKDNLIMRTINNLIAQVGLSEVSDGSTFTGRSGVKAINLLYEYNQATGNGLTVAEAIRSLDFLKFATSKIGLVSDYMTMASTLYNVGGRVRFTPKDSQHVVILSEFQKRADTYLQSDTYHNEFVKLPQAETVPFWQGSGKDFSFDNCSKIELVTDNGEDTTGTSVTMTGVVGCIFDREACGVSCPESKVTSHYNGNADFFNYWYKEFAGYFNDTNENCVVFYIA